MKEGEEEVSVKLFRIVEIIKGYDVGAPKCRDNCLNIQIFPTVVFNDVHTSKHQGCYY